MYLLNETEQQVHTSLREAILLLCQTGLKFDTELSVDGLLAVTVDKQHVFLVSIKETLQANERCNTNDDRACIHTSNGHAAVDFSLACQSTVTSVGSDGQSLPSSYEEQCTSNVTSLRLPTENASQREDESFTKSDQNCRQHHRKQQRTIHRFVDALCPTTSETAVSLELLSQPKLISDWADSDNSEVSVHVDNEDQQCNHACKNDLPSDIANQQDASIAPMALTLADSDGHTFLNCADQKCGEVIDSVSLPAEEQVQHQHEMLVIPPVPLSSNKDSVTGSDCMSKRSHRKRRRTVRRYLDHSANPVMSSSAMPLTSLSQTDHSHVPGWVDNVNGEASILNEVRDDHFGHVGKMSLLNGNSSDAAQAEYHDTSASLCLSANVKSEIVEPSSTNTDTISQLASLGHDMRPPCDPQQQMALMSQFCLPAIVSAAGQNVTRSWQLFPWTSPSLPPVQCVMLALHLLL